jgi:hypothetical protein
MRHTLAEDAKTLRHGGEMAPRRCRRWSGFDRPRPMVTAGEEGEGGEGLAKVVFLRVPRHP